MLSEDKIKELAYQLPINNIIKITHCKNSFLDRNKALKYKIKLVQQFIKLLEEVNND